MTPKRKGDAKKVESGQHKRRFELVELGRGEVARQRPAGPIKEGAPPGTRDHPLELQVSKAVCVGLWAS
jgi:hypothetical protein